MTYFIGTSPSDVINSFVQRYFYGLRRNDDGELFLIFLDQLSGFDDAVTINDYGLREESYQGFEEGIDYLDGIDATHDKVYDNLRYPQFNWDARYMTYYINDNGEFVMRINEGYNYPEGISAPGY